MNLMLLAAKDSLKRFGAPGKYTRISAGVYNIETGSATSTSTEYTIQMYEKNIKISQFNYPNLIGKSASIFYVCADAITFAPQPQDVIEFNSIKYVVDSYTNHMAHGQVVLYKILAVRS